MSVEALIARMKDFDGSFYGHNSSKGALDYALVDSALSPEFPNAVALLAHIASVHATNSTEYYCAKAYFDEYVMDMWEGKMEKNDNPVYMTYFKQFEE